MYRILSLVAIVASVCGCDLTEPKPFNMAVTPQQINDSIPLQQCVFLVTVENTSPLGLAALPVKIAAVATGAEVQVQNPYIRPGEVAEVVVIPAPLKNQNAQDNSEGRTISVTIQGTRSGLVATQTLPITVTSEEEDLVAETAVEMRDLFIPWLAKNRPELGIDEDTKWTGTIVTPHILVVTHYLFFSADWEMHVYWHVMIPPYNWARIELRQRFVETLPSVAFEIPSRTANPIVVNEIDPSEDLWR